MDADEGARLDRAGNRRAIPPSSWEEPGPRSPTQFEHWLAKGRTLEDVQAGLEVHYFENGAERAARHFVLAQARLQVERRDAESRAVSDAEIETARRSADAARLAARWAMWAALIAAAALIATAWPAFHLLEWVFPPGPAASLSR